MVQPRTTLRDIARSVGVHPSTVSRVLNPATRYKVSPAVAEQVADAARRLGYRPNPLALGLRTNRSVTVGVVVFDLTNPIFPPMIRGIEDALEAAGYTAILANSDNDTSRERRIVENMRTRHVDGLIMATADRHAAVVEACIEDNVPFVLINRVSHNNYSASVTVDDDVGMRLLVDHLASLGHRSIAHVAGPQQSANGRSRYEAFIKALRRRRVEPDPRLLFVCDTHSDSDGKRGTLALLDRGVPFTAIVAGNDVMAIGCYEALSQRGIACPEQVSVTGYNDIRFADKLQPPLTTIRIPQYEAGTAAAELLLARLRDPATPPRNVLMTPSIVVRGSTGPAPV